MRKFTRVLLAGAAILPLTVGTLMVATTAQAQVGPVTESAGTTLVFPLSTSGLNPPKLFGETTSGTWSESSTVTGTPYGGSDFASFVNQGSVISFESSNVTSGIGVQTTSTSLVSFNFTNPNETNVVFDSVIIPAGLGFYLANVDDGCKYSSCVQVTGAYANLAFLKPASFVLQDEAVPGDYIIGLASFDFSIKDGTDELYRVTGALRLKYNEIDGAFVDPVPFTPLGGGLNGFTRSTPFSDLSAVGYAWDATNVSFNLAPGLHSLSYSTSVNSWSLAKPLGCGASLVAFSGFGDPVGRGGGNDEAFAFFSAGPEESFFSAFSAVSTASDGCVSNGNIQGVNFTSASYSPPTFDGQRLTYGTDGGGGGGAVPEPATWAMMIAGFGLAGTALRRRRRVAYT